MSILRSKGFCSLRAKFPPLQKKILYATLSMIANHVTQGKWYSSSVADSETVVTYPKSPTILQLSQATHGIHAHQYIKVAKEQFC